MRQEGYEVIPVNPKGEAVEGLRAFKRIADVPVRPQMVSGYLPPTVTLKRLPDNAARGCNEVWLNPGTESGELMVEAARLKLKVIQACRIMGAGLLPESL